MIHLSVIDLAEELGFSTIYGATIAATRGNRAPLADLGILGITPDAAQHLATAIERAWLCDSLGLTQAVIAKARGRA